MMKKKIAHLNSGDALFFKADFVHAGSAYEKENYRLHYHIDNNYCLRTINKIEIKK